jgi:peptidoglycan/xylan/chitin deacetylase (PgdA/CDA1 family)
LISIVALASAISLASPAPARRAAVTFDDLPGASASVVGDGVPALEAMTRRLLAAVREARVPAIGFVNEGKLAPDGRREEARVAVLALWLDAGFELGNHTYSHLDLHRTLLPDFEEDVRRGEEVTRDLLRKRGENLRYFRHPFLHTGRDLPTKLGLEAFLKARGCRVAPVTHDNAEWIFARAYALAARRGDSATASRIAEAYVPYMDAKFEYFERQSQSLFGREIPQILLLHANSLNADAFTRLAAMMKKRGYTFVTLDRALEDAAYLSPDTYTGPGGITWLHRWALTRGPGLVLPDEPKTPDWVLREAGVDAE